MPARVATPGTAFSTVDENFTAYGLLDHRHTPEIEQNLGAPDDPATVLFTPHLAPMNRGILATCYAPAADGVDVSTEHLLDELNKAYRDEPFVHVTADVPATKAAQGSNVAFVTARFDARTGYIVVLCALDNLTKGASGGAVQSANVALGFDETAGLPRGSARAVTMAQMEGDSAVGVPTFSSRRCPTSVASPARPSSSSTAATPSPVPMRTTPSRSSPKTSC